jgi:hydroxyacylglutathione hydrolase
VQVEQFFLGGLGHQSYLVSDEQGGVAAVVDPRRDVDVYVEAAARANARITHILETHLHNDYVTGARELAARTGATIVASADAHLAYDHQPVHDGERFMVGTLPFAALATPGHTPEHVSYVVYQRDSQTPYAVFSGGSMLVGGAGRTDLLTPGLTLTLTRQQYHSLRRLLDTLPDTVRVYPTHGAGSFCGTGAISPTRSTTIAQERLASPVVHARDEDDFVRRQLAGYTAYPSYYAAMRAINMEGPGILGALPEPPALDPAAVREQMAAGVPLVDGRQRDAFAREHVLGALNIELDDNFGTYAGWVLPFNAPLLLVVEDEAGRREAVVQLIRIGYEQARGYLRGGMEGWKAAGLPVSSFARIDVADLYTRWEGPEPPAVLDVRRDEEWRAGHIPGSQHIHVADLPGRIGAVPSDRPIAVICASGYRASTAASLLAATGRTVVAVQGGVPGWVRQGHPVVTGDDDDGASAAADAATHAHP